MIAENLQLLSVVEDKEFKRFVNGLNHRYDLPSHRKIGRNLFSSIYNREVESPSRVRESFNNRHIMDIPTNKSIHHSDS